MTTFAYNLTLDVYESELLKYLLEDLLKRCKEMRKVNPKDGRIVSIPNLKRILEKMNSTEYAFGLYLPEGEGNTLRSLLSEVNLDYGYRCEVYPDIGSPADQLVGVQRMLDKLDSGSYMSSTSSFCQKNHTLDTNHRGDSEWLAKQSSGFISYRVAILERDRLMRVEQARRLKKVSQEGSEDKEEE